MNRLKELGTWVVLVIAFWLFSNGMIYLYLNGIGNKEVKNEAQNITVQK
ncbi:MAG: hypothetical protein K2H53_00960 [Clostridia bacterium]|nr:hypothetical protein [Clostridia bacterium]